MFYILYRVYIGQMYTSPWKRKYSATPGDGIKEAVKFLQVSAKPSAAGRSLIAAGDFNVQAACWPFSPANWHRGCAILFALRTMILDSFHFDTTIEHFWSWYVALQTSGSVAPNPAKVDDLKVNACTSSHSSRCAKQYCKVCIPDAQTNITLGSSPVLVANHSVLLKICFQECQKTIWNDFKTEGLAPCPT